MAYPISDVPRRIVYSGSAGVGPYAFTFEVLANTDIAVYKNTTLLTLTTDYTVTINTGTGTGTVTLVVAATSADTVTIVGDRAIQRTSDFVTGGDLFANTLNNELDAQTIYTQQVDEKADRAIRSPVTDPTTISMVLPSQASRAQKLLGFNASGEPTTYVATTTVSDTSLINFTQAGTGAVTRTAQAKMRDVVSVKDFGADPTGVADSTAAFNAAISYCIANNLTLTGEGAFKFLSPVNLRYICVQMPNATFNVAHAGIGLFIGGNASNANNPPQHIGTVSRSVGTDAYATPTVRCIGAKGQHIIIENAAYFQIYANTNPGVEPTDYSTAYSTFVLKYCDTVELTNNAATTGSPVQWINENFFYLNRTLNLLINGTYPHNNNYFAGGCFEGTATINIQSGWQNYIRDIRQEGTLAVTFAAGAEDNIVTIGWSSSSHRYPSGGLTVVNNGAMNAVQHNFDLYAPITPLVGFGYQTLKTVGSDYSVLGASNLTIGASNLSAVGFAQIYQSVLIPVNGENTVFELEILGSTAGGVRTKVDGYDASKTLITPASGQVEFDGAGIRQFGQYDTGSNTQNLARFFVLNPNCKFIIVTVIAGGVGATFDAFYLGARVPDIALRKKMMGYVYTYNNFV